MKVKVVSPEKTLYDGEAVALFLPGANGQFEVLNDHAPVLSTLREGVVACNLQNGESLNIEITGGFVEVARNVASVCVEVKAKQ